MINIYDFYDSEYILECARFFLDFLEVDREIELDIALVSESNFLGYATPHGINGRMLILIDDDPINDQIVTLAHECVHIKQFYSGQLVETNGFVVWKNEIYTFDDSPWELEAEELVPKMLEIFYDRDNNS